MAAARAKLAVSAGLWPLTLHEVSAVTATFAKGPHAKLLPIALPCTKPGRALFVSGSTGVCGMASHHAFVIALMFGHRIIVCEPPWAPDLV